MVSIPTIDSNRTIYSSLPHLLRYLHSSIHPLSSTSRHRHECAGRHARRSCHWFPVHEVDERCPTFSGQWSSWFPPEDNYTRRATRRRRYEMPSQRDLVGHVYPWNAIIAGMHTYALAIDHMMRLNIVIISWSLIICTIREHCNWTVESGLDYELRLGMGLGQKRSTVTTTSKYNYNLAGRDAIMSAPLS